MDLITACVAGVALSAISVGVGVYLQRFRPAVTEMFGMMIGMTLGMMTGIVVGYFAGAATDMFVGNLVGVSVGLAFGIGFGHLGGLMGMMDGGMAGTMGGMMGAMLGVMIRLSDVAIWVTAALMVVIYLGSLAGLVRMAQGCVTKQFARDPVCNMLVDATTAQLKCDHAGQTYYFCAPGCQRTFERNPASYLT